ncbi:hypothetical protein T310_7229 [Rasamsonia emersonii CBS 393.64]|uniref:Uncharacterized protein n=1 Tax=Rasamsonia emersonii (strain ATCC 16479 / CBS 393.64 / IMI 116815) TaxID=1408163 RepID=A0A0F4YKQ2_RASE3|nr:hypothetical protein T310_7229 [Rasamsonia emersonii CBS 393.64]KKA18809.1 hypothetical protein T310_7229 [Rasamsonia emersonii CBS 393.64]
MPRDFESDKHVTLSDNESDARTDLPDIFSNNPSNDSSDSDTEPNRDDSDDDSDDSSDDDAFYDDEEQHPPDFLPRCHTSRRLTVWMSPSSDSNGIVLRLRRSWRRQGTIRTDSVDFRAVILSSASTRSLSLRRLSDTLKAFSASIVTNNGARMDTGLLESNIRAH